MKRLLRLKVTSKSYPWTQLLSFLYSVRIPPVRNVSKTLDDTYTIHWGKRFNIPYGPLSRVTTQQNRDSYFKKKNTCFKQKIA